MRKYSNFTKTAEFNTLNRIFICLFVLLTSLISIDLIAFEVFFFTKGYTGVDSFIKNYELALALIPLYLSLLGIMNSIFRSEQFNKMLELTTRKQTYDTIKDHKESFIKRINLNYKEKILIGGQERIYNLAYEYRNDLDFKPSQKILDNYLYYSIKLKEMYVDPQLTIDNDDEKIKAIKLYKYLTSISITCYYNTNLNYQNFDVFDVSNLENVDLGDWENWVNYITQVREINKVKFDFIKYLSDLQNYIIV